jgi:hypothetical protein
MGLNAGFHRHIFRTGPQKSTASLTAAARTAGKAAIETPKSSAAQKQGNRCNEPPSLDGPTGD